MPVKLFFRLVVGLVTLLVLPSFSYGQDSGEKMLIRVDLSSSVAGRILSALPEGLDVAAYRPGEYADIVILPEKLGTISSAGLAYRVLMKNPRDLAGGIPSKAAYHTYDGIRTELKQIAADHPLITRLDTVAIAAQGGKVWCLKISDNPNVSDNSRHGILLMGLHHAREWMTPEICLHIANYLTDNYNPAGTDSISTLVKTKEIYIVPLVNPDGFVYDNGGNYGSGLMWRKNRRVNSPTVFGADLNRGYAGSVDGDIRGEWGGSVNSYTSPDSSNDVFYGVAPSGEPEQQAMMDLVRQHNIVLSISYHSYSELLLWPLGYVDSTVKRAPDSLELRYFGQQSAARIKRYRSTQGYTPQQSSALYPTTGDSDGWIYGYGLTQLGRVIFPYCVEVDTAFYTPPAHIDSVCPQVLKGFMYLAMRTDSLVSTTSPPPVLPPPITRAGFPSASTDLKLTWRQQNPAALPSAYALQEFFRPGSDSATAETATDDKVTISNFTRSTTRKYQGSYSFFSGTGAYRLAGIVTNNPYLVKSSSDSFRFYSYQGMTSFDRVWVESSYDGKQWKLLGKLYGNTGTAWNRRAYSIGADSGKALYFRIRYAADGTTAGDGGLYIDNIFPAANYASINVLSSSITDTSYLVTGRMIDSTYYYRTRGYNSKRGWGDWGQLFAVKIVMGPLAVELASFTAVAAGAGVELAWSTASESECQRWEVERSEHESEGFIVIGTVPGHLTTNEPHKYSYTDASDLQTGIYYYRLAEVDVNGNRSYYGPQMVEIGGKDLPSSFCLEKAYPNPATRSATIRYGLRQGGLTSLKVYNVLGQEVRILVSGHQPAGYYTQSWDGRDNQGRPAANGVYLYQLISGDFSATNKLTLVR